MRLFARTLIVVLLCTAGMQSVTPAFESPIVRCLDSLEIAPQELMQHDALRAAEMYYKKDAAFGKFYAVPLFDIVQNALAGIAKDDYAKVFIVCSSTDGSSTSASLAELDPEQAKLPAVILIGDLDATPVNKFTVSDLEGQKGVIDTEQLLRQSSQRVRLRYYMNDVQLKRAERKRLKNAEMTVVFPRDRTAARWISNVHKVYVMISH